MRGWRRTLKTHCKQFKDQQAELKAAFCAGWSAAQGHLFDTYGAQYAYLKWKQELDHKEWMNEQKT
jgi:hypothetical protein